ncbi:LOW QUALITY PROTEIN: putative uncharacterized protein encoded by MIR7-3HG [Saimiri boliviensis]|uniref:LOW QUALITY PROTEIN: putative uncharacterized protein encoded by MIR7-3HG n=1 Tax=Saimiri boliviensis TaxID=27679 RepID=UPI003D786E9E
MVHNECSVPIQKYPLAQFLGRCQTFILKRTQRERPTAAWEEGWSEGRGILGRRLVCRSAHRCFRRKGQRWRSWTVWKAETSGADCLGAPSLGTVPLGGGGGTEKRTTTCFSTGAQDSSQWAPFRRQDPGQLLQLGMHSPHLHPETPATEPAFFCKLHFIKGNNPDCLIISHVKSVLTFSETWDIVSPAHSPIIFKLSSDMSICLPVTL